MPGIMVPENRAVKQKPDAEITGMLCMEYFHGLNFITLLKAPVTENPSKRELHECSKK